VSEEVSRLPPERQQPPPEKPRRSMTVQDNHSLFNTEDFGATDYLNNLGEVKPRSRLQSSHVFSSKRRNSIFDVLDATREKEHIDEMASREPKICEPPIQLMRLMYFFGSLHFPARELGAAKQAGKRLAEELFQQGDQMRAQGVELRHAPPCYDREWGNPEVGLAGFVDLVIAPTFRILVEWLPQMGYIEDNMRRYRRSLLKRKESLRGEESLEPDQEVRPTTVVSGIEMTHATL